MTASPRARVPDRPSLDGLENTWVRRWEKDGIYRFGRAATRDRVYSIDLHCARSHLERGELPSRDVAVSGFILDPDRKTGASRPPRAQPAAAAPPPSAPASSSGRRVAISQYGAALPGSVTSMYTARLR